MAERGAGRAGSKASKGTTGGKPRRVRSRRARIWRRVLAWSLALFLVVGLAGVGAFLYLYSTTKLPDPNSDFTTNTTFIYYNDGRNQLGSLAVQNRVTLDYAEMPQLMKDAVVAAENQTFWEDPGFSITGIARGAWSIATGGEVQGGSTITQQYIKILYLDSSRTLNRKVRELMLAIKMGRELPKEEILEGYLNTIYFGRGAYGIQAAAKSYFLKDAKDLTVAETAVLAAILNNPAGFNPSGGEAKREKLLGRYQYVLRQMKDMGTISEADYQAANPALPIFPDVPVNNRYGGAKGFLIRMVEDELGDLGFGEGEIAGGGYKITTTFDKRMQEAAVNLAQDHAKQAAEDAEEPQDPSQLHVAISSVDTASGSVLALYGGADYVANSRNWSTTPRPAASTFKSFAALAGFRNGFSLKSVLNGDTFTPDGDSQTIRNEFSEQYGPVSLRRAIADSINTAFVDMTQQIEGGPDAVIKAANDAGAPTGPGWDPNNRIALGAAEVSPLNMANAYATFADSGKYKGAHVVAKVEDREGNVLYEAKPEAKQQIDPNEAANLTDALTSVVSEGTGTKASALERPVAGKTGTNGVEDDITSAWFVGYTRQISTAVMYVAGDSGNEDLDDYKRPDDPTFFGSSYPLMTWVEFMKIASEGMEVRDFDEPKPLDGKDESETESPSPTDTPTPTETETPTPTVSETPTPTPTPTPTVSETPTPTEPEPTTPEPTQEPTTPEPTQSASIGPPPSPEPTQEASPEPSPGSSGAAADPGEG